MIEVIRIWSMMQNVCFKRLCQRKKFQWKIIKTIMSILLVSLLLYLCVVIKRLVVVLYYLSNYEKEDMKTNVFLFIFSACIFQEEDEFNRISLVLPGSLLPFKNEVVNIFEKEKHKSCRKERYAKVFRNISISAIFANRSNIKRLVVKTKIA